MRRAFTGAWGGGVENSCGRLNVAEKSFASVFNVIYIDLKRSGVPLWNLIFIGFLMCSAPLFLWEGREKYYVTDFTNVVGYENAHMQGFGG